jgi:hypothetical protein
MHQNPIRDGLRILEIESWILTVATGHSQGTAFKETCRSTCKSQLSTSKFATQWSRISYFLIKQGEFYTLQQAASNLSTHSYFLVSVLTFFSRKTSDLNYRFHLIFLILISFSFFGSKTKKTESYCFYSGKSFFTPLLSFVVFTLRERLF